LIDSWKDAFTIVGGFAATALTVVTIHRGGSSKGDMKIPEAIIIQLTNLCNDMDHMKTDFKTMGKKWENTHRQVNEIRMAMVAWNKMPLGKSDSDTDTGEI
jgi:hypothetical protein